MVVEINPLSSKSVEAAIKKIERYQEDLQDKCYELISRLVDDVGLPVIKARVDKAKGDSDKDYNYIVVDDWDNPDPNVKAIELKVSGDQFIFIEFGAGIHFNGPVGSSSSPVGEQLGYTIGSYSRRGGNGLSYGQYDKWRYIDSSGVEHESYGTEGTAPVYSAAQAMRNDIARIAGEVFGKGGIS